MIIRSSENLTNKLISIGVLLSSLILSSHHVASETAFTYNDDLSCDSPVSIDVESFSCEGSSICQTGDKVKVSGTATFTSDIPEEVCVKAKLCFMGISFICKEANAKFDACHYFSSSNGDSDCPNAGYYTFETDFSLPEMQATNLGSGWWVTSYADVTSCDSSSSNSLDISCKASFSAVSSSSSTAGAITGFSFVGIGLLAGLYIRKRRRVGKINLAREEEIMTNQDCTGHFEMLSDDSVRV